MLLSELMRGRLLSLEGVQHVHRLRDGGMSPQEIVDSFVNSTDPHPLMEELRSNPQEVLEIIVMGYR